MILPGVGDDDSLPSEGDRERVEVALKLGCGGCGQPEDLELD